MNNNTTPRTTDRGRVHAPTILALFSLLAVAGGIIAGTLAIVSALIGG